MHVEMAFQLTLYRHLCCAAVEWWNGGMAEWRNGGMAEWQNGGIAEWGMAEWWNGGWRNGGMAERLHTEST